MKQQLQRVDATARRSTLTASWALAVVTTFRSAGRVLPYSPRGLLRSVVCWIRLPCLDRGRDCTTFMAFEQFVVVYHYYARSYGEEVRLREDAGRGPTEHNRVPQGSCLAA